MKFPEKSTFGLASTYLNELRVSLLAHALRNIAIAAEALRVFRALNALQPLAQNSVLAVIYEHQKSVVFCRIGLASER
jgi:hypothetical protein